MSLKNSHLGGGSRCLPARVFWCKKVQGPRRTPTLIFRQMCDVPSPEKKTIFVLKWEYNEAQRTVYVRPREPGKTSVETSVVHRTGEGRSVSESAPVTPTFLKHCGNDVSYTRVDRVGGRVDPRGPVRTRESWT